LLICSPTPKAYRRRGRHTPSPPAWFAGLPRPARSPPDIKLGGAHFNSA
jgi:hypothetical protein